MNSKRMLLAGTALVLGGVIVLAGLLSQPLYSAVDNRSSSTPDLQAEQGGEPVPDFRVGGDNLYRYSIERKRSGDLYVLVDGDFRDTELLQRYLQANRSKADALIRKGGPPVRVTVSFAKPVPIADFEALVKATGFEADNYSLEIRDEQGRPAWFGGRAVPLKDGNLVDLEAARPGLERIQGSISGAIYVVGTVPPTRDGLGRLLADPSVYLADVMAAEVAELVSKETGVVPAKIRVEVFPVYSFIRGGTQ
ncbi:MAG: hypothetical protein Q8R28_17430 [Dehalococcoidia bacterium]|nr:hypothetical protein [Dehalococcoidia bacterium]